MPQRFPAGFMLSSFVTLSSVFFASTATAERSNLIASIQGTSGALMKQASALMTAGQVAQAAITYIRAGDAALNESQFSIAEQAYQQAATAFHRVNQPSGEATAYEKLAAVYEQEAGVATAGTRAATPALPAKSVKPAAAPPATAAHPAQTAPAVTAPATPAPAGLAAAWPQSGLYTCSESAFLEGLYVYGDLRIRDGGTYQGVRLDGASTPVNPYTYSPATHAVTWKGDLGGKFGTSIKSVYFIDNEGKPDFLIKFQLGNEAHEMNCVLEHH